MCVCVCLCGFVHFHCLFSWWPENMFVCVPSFVRLCVDACLFIFGFVYLFVCCVCVCVCVVCVFVGVFVCVCVSACV